MSRWIHSDGVYGHVVSSLSEYEALRQILGASNKIYMEITPEYAKAFKRDFQIALGCPFCGAKIEDEETREQHRSSPDA